MSEIYKLYSGNVLVTNYPPNRETNHFYFRDVVCERSEELARAKFAERASNFCKESDSPILGGFNANGWISIVEFKVPGFKITVEQLEQKAQSS